MPAPIQQTLSTHASCAKRAAGRHTRTLGQHSAKLDSDFQECLCALPRTTCKSSLTISNCLVLYAFLLRLLEWIPVVDDRIESVSLFHFPYHIHFSHRQFDNDNLSDPLLRLLLPCLLVDNLPGLVGFCYFTLLIDADLSPFRHGPQALDSIQSKCTMSSLAACAHTGTLDRRTQGLGYSSPLSHTGTNPAEGLVAIGIVYSTGTACKNVFKCPKNSCLGATFNRLADLKRHHASMHEGFGGKQTQFWCPIDGCEYLIFALKVVELLLMLYYFRRQKPERQTQGLSEKGQDDGSLSEGPSVSDTGQRSCLHAKSPRSE